ncbi:telomere length regulation protein TEL2 homolog isoform X2 [Planococcus citri]|uniref:telomere length regulation protein TEL2 homolog isoform X2 n=1 Tax=Planococcus citri TaxID=170843 RepID=UPI0031F8316A
MWRVRDIADKITNVVMNYTEIEAKVRAATNDEAWGPTGALMQEIAHATFTFEHFPEVMTMLWKRMLQDNKSNWRRTYKSLLLLNYLVRNGSERVVTSSREHIYDLRGLENYSFIDEFGKDQGINIRHKVKELIEFIQDDEKLREERKKAKKNKDKFIGMSNEGISGSRGFDENQWDGDKNKGTTLGFYEPSYDSDENENKYDSEGEPDTSKVPPIAPSNNNIVINTSSPLSTPANVTPTRTKAPTKKIDLGAAANYGKDASSTAQNIEKPTPNQPPSSDLLGDILFDTNSTVNTASPVVETTSSPSQENIADFGEFTAAFSNVTLANKTNNNDKVEDEFADFSSAFSGPTSNSSLDNISSPVAPSNNSSFSNTDLLSGFATNDTPSLLDTSTSLNSSANSTRRMHPVLRHESEEEFKRLLSSLNVSDERSYEKKLKTISTYRPRPLTPQMMEGIDDYDDQHSLVFGRNYAHLLDLIGAKISSNLLMPLITDLFALDGAGDAKMLLESVTKLTNLLKDSPEGPSTRLDNVVSICRRVVSGDFLTSALTRRCLQMHDVEGSLWWDDLVQILVSLPSRIANKMRTQMPEFFATRNYVRLLNSHVLKCTQILAEARRHGVELRLEPVAGFVSKIISHFECSSQELPDVIRVLEVWSSKYKYDLIPELFASLEGSCVNKVAYCVLTQVKNLKNISMLGSCLTQNSRWRYCLCDYMLFKTFYVDESDKILINMISYLKKYPETLTEVIQDLLRVWSDKSALTRTSFEQHLYISKAIVLAAKALSELQTLPTDIVQRKLFAGIPNHLEASDERMRAIGMIVAEVIIGRMNLPGGKITFEYDDLKKESVRVVDSLRICDQVDLEGPKDTQEDDSDPLEEYLGKTCFTNQSKYSKTESATMKTVSIQETPIPKLASIRNVKDGGGDEDDDESWDSDDELTPYDLSNDVKISEMKKPRYLRDLIEGLTEQKDPDIWIGSVESCESLVKQQLVQDDPCIGVEILSILLTLERQFYMENFEQIRYDACVAILNVYPEQGASYVCEQFHQAAGKYTISHKMLMLDILVGSARDLSTLKTTTPQLQTKKHSQTIQSNQQWRSLIEKRIEQNTRYITNRKNRSPLTTKANDFNSCVGYFFYPLIRGSAKQTNIMVHLVGAECHPLLAQYIDALAVIMCSAVNCTMAGKMGLEMMEFIKCFVGHSDFKVRSAVLKSVAAVIISVPKSVLMEGDLFAEILRAHSWMEQMISKQAEPNTECRKLMEQVFGLMKTSFSFNTNL